MTLKRKNLRLPICATPTITGTKVRMMGTKRARIRALPPCFSKNAWALSTFSFLKSRESGLLKIAGPALDPMR